MKVEIDLAYLKKFNLSVDQFIILKLIYLKEFSDIKEFYGVKQAVSIRNALCFTPFVLSDENVKFTETLLSKEKVEKLLMIRSEDINFWEFYVCYPMKVGTRILRAASNDAKLAEKHQKKYLREIKTVEQHELAVKSIKAFVAKKKQENSLEYLPMMETVMNNNMWEQWSVFIEEIAKGGKEWNNERI